MKNNTIVLPSRPNSTGPLTFVYEIPVQPISRHQNIFGSWLGELIGIDGAQVKSRCQERWKTVSHGELEPLVEFLCSLPPESIAVTDSEAVVELSAREKEEDARNKELFEKHRSSPKELFSALRDQHVANGFGMFGQLTNNEEHDIREKELKDHYEKAYEAKLEEFSKLPPLATKENISDIWLTLNQNSSKWLITISENPPLKEPQIFPFPEHPELAAFLENFGGLAVSSCLPNQTSGFIKTHELDVVSKGQEMDWGNYDEEWEGSLLIYRVGNGDQLVVSKTGRIGRFYHEIGWGSNESSINKTEHQNVGELITDFVLFAKDPIQRKNSVFW